MRGGDIQSYKHIATIQGNEMCMGGQGEVRGGQGEKNNFFTVLQLNTKQLFMHSNCQKFSKIYFLALAKLDEVDPVNNRPSTN